MNPREVPEVLRPLPIGVRPRPTEPVESYVRRLAHANHLRPSYLHAYLCGPPAWLGAVDLGRLAVLCGRPAVVLQRTLTELAPDPPPPPARDRRPRPVDAPAPAPTVSPSSPTPRRQARPAQQHRRAQTEKLEQRIDLFAAIRHDAQFLGASIRALARRHHVHRRTILQALDSPIPPPRKPLPPRKSQVDPYTDTIDAILLEDRARPPHRRHTIRRIWERLTDEHDAQVSYSIVRVYVARRRQQLDADTDYSEGEERGFVMADDDGLRLEMRRVLRAPRAVVFRALTEPEELAKWWGPARFSVPRIDSDLRAGGAYRIAMQPPEGELFYLVGEFLEVNPPERVAYTFRWEDPDPQDRETVVTLSLRDLGGGETELVFTQGDFATERRRVLHEGGWTEGLSKLEAVVSPAAPV